MENLLKNQPDMNVRESFEGLTASLHALITALTRQSPDYPCFVASPADDSRQGRAAALWIYSQLFYQRGQDKRATLVRPGFLGTSPEVIVLANTVNMYKDAFNKAMQDIKQRHRQQTADDLQKANFERNPGQAETLRYSGLGTLHLKQTYRHIPLINCVPRRIGLCWSKGSRSTEKLTYQQAEDALARFTDDATAMRLLADIEPGARLARVRMHSPHVRANLVVPPECNEGKKNKQVNTPMPLLFPTQNLSMPLYTPVPYDPEEIDSQRLSRDDQQIDYGNPVFLNESGTIGIYPYL